MLDEVSFLTFDKSQLNVFLNFMLYIHVVQRGFTFLDRNARTSCTVIFLSYFELYHGKT